MILEVGAGGCIMITPPAKGSQLEKALGHVMDIGSGCSVYSSERYMNGEKIGGVTVGSIQFENAEKSPEYARYLQDIHKVNDLGQIQRDVNGNWIFLHRAGDVMLDVNGDPLLVSRDKPKFDVRNHSAPRVVSNGIKDGQQNHDPVADAISRLEYWTNEEFEDLLDKVQKETRRRLTNGGPLSHRDNPHTVASI